MMETFTRINSGILRGLSVVNGDSKLTMCMLPESPKTAVQNGSHSSERFKEMFEETKALIELKSFDTAITSCSDIAYTYGKEEFRSICAASVGEGLQNGCVDSHKIPFPKMIPLIVRSYSNISDLEKSNGVEDKIQRNILDRITSCSDLQDFQKVIFFPMQETGITPPTEQKCHC
eukprot:TRINITY_DN6379_c0_g1_i2.p1 TRINITY_DN6379_c0_g1~~TRINITY_DN6379_c0_g1_i2.p1  ORF type:complete len:175 (+),score=25.72 TRINITY_DN6379_c0_g1_i2:477-1001(+)